MGGIVLVNKPVDCTSHDVVKRLRQVFQTKKVGHAGTLDPFATGLLLVCVEEATRIVEYLTECEKEYVAEMKLGESTDTQDCTGTVEAIRPVASFRETELRQTFARFMGTIPQVPPMFSARRIDGTRLYKLARQGETVDRPARQVTITALEILELALPLIRFRVVCSKGTYIRTLAHDIGEVLGCGAHLRALERRRIGPFWLREAVSLEQVMQMTSLAEKRSLLIPTDQALSFLPAVSLDEQNAGKLIHGTRVTLRAGELTECGTENRDDEVCRVYSAQGRFLALARKSCRTNCGDRLWTLQPLKVFVPQK